MSCTAQRSETAPGAGRFPYIRGGNRERFSDSRNDPAIAICQAAACREAQPNTKAPNNENMLLAPRRSGGPPYRRRSR